MNKRLMKGIFVGACALLSSSAWAANDGTEGETSTGDADITVTIPKLVKITGIADLSFDYTNGGDFNDDFDQHDDVCIYSNLDNGTYKVNITGANPSGGPNATGFFVGNGDNGQTIPFTLEWNDVAGTNVDASPVTHGDDLTDQDGYTNDATCANNTENARFRVQMTKADMLEVHDGEYTSTITILITPE